MLFIFVLRVFYVFNNFHDFYQIYQAPYFFGIIFNIKKEESNMYKYDDIANWFLSRRPINPKKLNKLVYFAYAWALTLEHKKLFTDGKFEAWINGPIIPKLFYEYKNYGYEEIDKVVKRPSFDRQTESILNQVWRIYGRYNADQLESLTHQSTPWQNARKGCSPLEKCTKIIKDEDIVNYYSKGQIS